MSTGSSLPEEVSNRLKSLEIDNGVLDAAEDQPEQSADSLPPLPVARTSSRAHIHDGYGFRPPSGVSTPLTSTTTEFLVPDLHGLGWPGESTYHSG